MIAVRPTEELSRVRALPRRVLDPVEAAQLARVMTPQYSIHRDAELRPWQAVAIAEARECGGAWLCLPVGQGKTLISALLPTAMQASRTLLIVPASLRNKTLSDFASYVGRWRMPRNPIRVETRERLSIVSGASLLDEYAPDLIVIDEADDLSNPKSAASRRLDRYIRSHQDVRVVAMTGTPARMSIMGYWHLVVWCLGDRAPLPLGHDEAIQWALALDVSRGRPPMDPGPLSSIQGTVRARIEDAREWYRQRLSETPGVVIVDEDSCDAPLTVRIRICRDDPALDAAFEHALVEMENPDGIPVSDPLSRWLLDAQLGLGLYSRWNPPPPEEWRAARCAVARFVRERIDASTHSARPMDTEAQVLHRYASHPIVTEWMRIKPTFDGATETVWISRSTLDEVHAWIAEQTVPGIVWCGSVDFARALATESRLAYYGRAGVTDEGSPLHCAPTDRSLIASWNANKKGFNLQAFRRQLLVMPPQSAKWYEQIFGRSHRSGQTDPVIVDVLATSGGTLDTFDAAMTEAVHVRDTVSLTQKILRARILRNAPQKSATNEFRWTRKESRS